MVGGAGDAAGSRGVDFGLFGVWVAQHRAPLRVAASLVVLVSLLLWNHPRGATVLLLGIVLLVLLAAIEFVARASALDLPDDGSGQPAVSA